MLSNISEVVEKDPEDDFKSFADYLADKEAKKVVADVKIRQANEGVEDPKWKKLTKIENTEEVFIEVKVCTKCTHDDDKPFNRTTIWILS